MVHKAEVAIEKAAVTLSRGFRSEALGSSGEGQHQAYPHERHDAEEFRLAAAKSSFSLSEQTLNFRVDSFTVKHTMWKNSNTCAEFKSWVY